MRCPTVIVAGPTASGKSALAVAIAEAFDGVVINADSMQLYRELEILTARPGADETARAPHRLYGILAAGDVCSAGRWHRLAQTEIDAARNAGKLPIVTGGTGLYLKTLVDGLAAVPDLPDAVRQAARDRHAALGGEVFYRELAARDPRMATRIHPGDSQRLIRAWEVIEGTGRSLADWQEQTGVEDAGTGPFVQLLLAPPRAELYATCDARFSGMIAKGALDEVRALDALELNPALPLMKALGVPDLRRHLAGEIGLSEAVARGQRETRRYAKRQMTWFRHQMIGANRYDAQYSERLTNEIFSFIRQFLLTRIS